MSMSGDVCCTDNRFEIIAAYKKKLIEGTNIEESPEEMAVIDNILFRFWQMEWLAPIPHGRLIDADVLMQSLGITNMECDKCAWYDGEWSRCKRGGDFEDACFAIENSPTIIPAEEGEA